MRVFELKSSISIFCDQTNTLTHCAAPTLNLDSLGQYLQPCFAVY
jgi:hypothetical protein